MLKNEDDELMMKRVWLYTLLNRITLSKRIQKHTACAVAHIKNVIKIAEWSKYISDGNIFMKEYSLNEQNSWQNQRISLVCKPMTRKQKHGRGYWENFAFKWKLSVKMTLAVNQLTNMADEMCRKPSTRARLKMQLINWLAVKLYTRT